MDKKENKIYSVDGLIFNLANESEKVEGFEFSDENSVLTDGIGNVIDVDNDVVMMFLMAPETKAFILLDEDREAKLIAKNFLTGESIKIGNLGNHIIAQNEVLLWAYQKKLELKKNKDAEILNNDMIKEINRLLFHGREGEIGIGEYRDYTYLGEPCNVYVTSVEDGSVPNPTWQPEPGGDGNVENKMTKLVNWVNSEDFRNRDPYERAAIFHSKFIRIHPFRDGNGRTGRMLINYMLALSGKPLTNIREGAHSQYYDANERAIVNNEYEPLIKVMKNNSIKNSSDLYVATMNYSKEKGINMKQFNVSQVNFNPNTK